MTIPYSTDTDSGGGGGTTIINNINNVDLINENPVIIGTENASATTGTDCIAIGKTSGSNQLGINNIAIGKSSGSSQIVDCIAIGNNSGNLQSTNSIAIGSNSAGASNTQWERTIAIGTNAQQNYNSVGLDIGNEDAIAIGSTSGGQQGKRSIAIGKDSGAIQDLDCIAIGTNAGAFQRDKTICIGYQAGSADTNDDSISIGTSANSANCGTNSIAIGKNSMSASNNSIVLNATGSVLTSTNQDSTFIAPIRGNTSVKPVLLYDTTDKELLTQTSLTVNSNNDEVACTAELKSERLIFNNGMNIGTNAGVNNQSADNIAIGENALNTASIGEDGVIAIGRNACFGGALRSSISIGGGASRFAAGINSISIGSSANTLGGGADSVAIGTLATSPNLRSMVLNATGSYLTSANDNATYIAPLRSVSKNVFLCYDTTSKEVSTGDLTKTDPIQVGTNPDSATTGEIAIGEGAGASQAEKAVALGFNSGASQALYAIAIGFESGATQASHCIAIGSLAGENQQSAAIAIGVGSGRGTQNDHSVCIGSEAGNGGAGLNSILIGRLANGTNNNTIVLNAKGTPLTAPFGNSCFIDPIRVPDTNTTTTRRLNYDTSNKEVRAVQDGIMYGNLALGSRNSTTLQIIGISNVYNSNTSVFSLASNQITVLIAGHYKISFTDNLTSTATRSFVRYSVFQNGTEVQHSRATAYIRGGLTGSEGSVYGHCLSFFNANDLVEFRYIRLDNSAGNNTAITTRYIIEKLD